MAKNKMHTSHSSQYANDEWGCLKWCEYAMFIILASLLLIAACVLTIFWTLNYKGAVSFDWDNKPEQAFKLHPILMVTGFITLSGFSMLAFRVCRCFRRIWVKLFHTIIHSLAIASIVVGFICTFQYFEAKGAKHFYSMHSWLGLITLGMFALQFFFGFFSFLFLACCSSSTAWFRARMVPIHGAFGLTTFFLAVATCLTGMMQEFVMIESPDARFLSFFGGNSAVNDSKKILPDIIYIFKTEHLLLNTLAVVFVGLLVLFTYSLRGPPRADSDALPCSGWVANQKVKSSASRATIGTY